MNLDANTGGIVTSKTERRDEEERCYICAAPAELPGLVPILLLVAQTMRTNESAGPNIVAL